MNKIMFFAHLRDRVGEESLTKDVSGKTISELKQMLEENYGLKLDSVMAAVNEEFASDDEVIQAGDTIAFIPPVSGG
ncbi:MULTISPECIES: molybdopterin converting factor subunit 1 [Cytobacillus]|jgi:molybdopterin synthase sulfur carrier subunit|uniref:Molybdopterin synthase sulfur carrier subunit n=1 Tax=Cytobacillus pseudoceanisediminis TaxID=3051614 RepID=A0ABZ2ZIL6_9BACI|nr:molybdopterin converting factor subunit 1 [Cytobacillus oceanisediminis]MBY0157819.1 molybdopterin converting factor subunit 1 [Cytobacillus firmus]MBU8730661.1 molybdopterin converting factor subunit 1 [Cytobacillus oceanisediminis]MCM3243866.1 molybdopterin converting factor subunit 1 [Cytobacillus oceanisediminis]MCM3528823.1 molybdopterin converting factor subunit 1 [Cytobacillus oceanisediminis]MCS0825473.1 molybdopterin converting factor subunit 1 [Cytobacillus firmus]